METVIVTCIYNNLSGTSFGGRNNRNGRYFRSLRTICGTGATVVCYTSTSDYHEVVHELGDITNLEIRILDLDALPFSRQIQETKRRLDTSDVYWRERCFEIMWGKLHMMRLIADEYHPKTMYWMDAGLSHRDVISSKYYRPEDVQRDRTENTVGVFTPTLLRGLNRFRNGKLFLVQTTVAHNKPMPEKYNTIPYSNHNSAIGGIFGGNTDDIRWLADEFFEKAYTAMNAGELYSEEGILFSVFNDHQSRFATAVFDVWYHEGWGERYDPSRRNFSQIVDDLLRLGAPT